VTKAFLTVTADNKSKVYGAANPVFTVSYTGLVNGDTPAALGGTLAFYVPAASAGAGNYAITPSGLTSSDYSITFDAGLLTVTKASLTVTADDKSKVYGAANPAFSASYSGFVNGDGPSALGGTLAFSTAATAASPVGSYPVTPSGLTSANYTIGFANGTLTVSKASLTITADDKSKVYGAANPTFTASYSGLVNGDTPGSLGGALVFAAPAASAGVGTYAITPSGVTSANYTIGFANGTLTVSKASLTITADNKSKVYGAANPTFTASYSGLVNGDTPGSLAGTLAFAAPPASAGVGTYAITPSGVTSANYTISFANGTLTVNPAGLTVTAVSTSKILGAPNPSFAVTYSGFVNGDGPGALGGALAFSTTATTASPVGSYPITPSGLTSTNYTITFVNGALSIFYGFSGFLQPINDTAHTQLAMSVFKAGSTVPVKFQLQNASGAVVQSASLPLFVTPVRTGTTTQPIDEQVYTDPPSSGQTFRWDGSQYIYNWQTPKDPGGLYRLCAKFDDGSTPQCVNIGLK
jgi:hypothetical protein